MSTITCRSCDREFHNSATYCPQCGASQSTLLPAGRRGAGADSGNAYITALKKYAVFSGRARWKEYWSFVVTNLLIVIAINIVDAFYGFTGSLSMVYSLVMLVPAVAAGFRRLHDTGHSGLWLFVPFVGMVLLLLKGQAGCNRFGPDPRETA